MPENTLLRYFFSSGSEVDPEDRFHLNRKTRTRRLKEISDILRKHHFLKGFTPEAFRAMLEDLGPSFVKIGQTLSTDVYKRQVQTSAGDIRHVNVNPLDAIQMGFMYIGMVCLLYTSRCV